MVIKNKQQLLEILDEDLSRFGNKPGVLSKLLGNEEYFIWKYIEHLRHIEYHQNKFGIHKLLRLWHFYLLKRLQAKLHLAIYPNTIGPGFRIYHIGAYTHVGPNVSIGKHCTFVSGVVFGNRTEEEDNRPVVVGDNCYFGIDCKILGPVKIGNNVTIGANAIVTKDVPDGVTVVGVNKLIMK